MELNIAIIYGSVRSERQGIKAANFFIKKLQERKIKTSLIDPLEMKLPLLDKMYKEYNPKEALPAMQEISEALLQADGFLIVTGEYNHSIQCKCDRTNGSPQHGVGGAQCQAITRQPTRDRV